jgi:radical SAM protein with 4Fe4S-binding SPASM domain
MRALVDEAAELGIRQIQVEPASIVGRGANMRDGPPDPVAFADAFLDALHHALQRGVALSTSAWSHARVGDGRYCAAVSGTRALTPDGFLSSCTEVSNGAVPADPFLVGRHIPGKHVDIWPEREARLQCRVGYAMPHCQHCYMVDTCGGGCASRARALSGDIFDRDAVHCSMSRHINPRLMADIAEGRLVPDSGWQPMQAELNGSDSALPGLSGRLVALVPPFARRRWNADPGRRPVFAPGRDAPLFFHLP